MVDDKLENYFRWIESSLSFTIPDTSCWLIATPNIFWTIFLEVQHVKTKLYQNYICYGQDDKPHEHVLNDHRVNTCGRIPY